MFGAPFDTNKLADELCAIDKSIVGMSIAVFLDKNTWAVNFKDGSIYHLKDEPKEELHSKIAIFVAAYDINTPAIVTVQDKLKKLNLTVDELKEALSIKGV